MRTNIEIDERLIRQAMEVSGAATKRQAVDLALREMIRVARQTEVRKFRGKLHWEGDLDAMRTD
jgi:Arc/MetJ family transcription regulator